MKKPSAFMKWWSCVVVDAILYGSIASYIGHENSIINIWSLLRYVIICVAGIGIEKECQKIRKTIRTKTILLLVAICAIVILVLGYFLSTLTFYYTKFFLCLLCLLICSFIGTGLLIYVFKYSSPNDMVIRTLDKDEENKRIIHMIESEDGGEANLVKGIVFLGGSMVAFTIMYLIIPILIRNTTINLFVLFKCGGLIFIMFLYLNWKKYGLVGKKNKKKQFYVETGFILIGMVLMYYVDGYIYRGVAYTNILLNFMYAFCVLPFLISNKKISTEFLVVLSKKD